MTPPVTYRIEYLRSKSLLHTFELVQAIIGTYYLLVKLQAVF